MATKITNAALIAAGEAMLRAVQITPISYAEMDCQALVEALLIECGIPAKACNLAGSNAHFRACDWRGTPEECVKRLGAVPGGALLFIVEPESEATPAKYRGDGLGDANHVYVYLGGGRAIHSSQSRGGVCESTNFKGTKTVPNGGVNYIGLSCWVDYGLSDAQMAALGLTAEAAQPAATGAQEAATAVAGIDTSEYYTVKQGCLGGAVRRLQGWLGDLGAGLQVDGEFGPATNAAVRAFQQAQGLTVDGIVGQKTWEALAEARRVAMAAKTE
jgi:hypothetical protein